MIDQRKREAKKREILRRLEEMAEKGLVPFDLLQQCAATRDIDFRGLKPNEIQLRAETFRVSRRADEWAQITDLVDSIDKRSKALIDASALLNASTTPQRRLTLLEELNSAMSTNGLVPVRNLDRVAYHEAGHVVVNRDLSKKDHRFTVIDVEVGLTPRNVFVGVPGGMAEGLTQRLGPGYGRPYVLSLLAGLVAETLAFGGIDSGADKSSDVRHAVAEISDREELGDVWRTAKRVLIDRWANVEVLAAALLQHRKLTGAQVDRLLGEA